MNLRTTSTLPGARSALIAVVALLLPATAGASVPKAATAGQPTITAGAGPAYFLWHDDQGWHLRWTGKAGAEKPAEFTGIISVPSARISMIRPQMKGGNDSLNRIDQTRAFFKSVTGAAVEGMDFKVPPKTGSIYLELFINYDVLAPASVFLGKGGAHPDQVSPAVQIRLEAVDGE